MADYEYEGNPDPPPAESKDDSGGEAGTGASASGGGQLPMDTKYIRSLEGIMKLVSIPVVIIGLILTAIGAIGFGGWFIFVGVGYLFYVGVVLVVETFIPNHYVHRLIDAVIMGIYALLWGITAVANLGVAIAGQSALVGVGMIFAVACCGLCVAGMIFAIQTYRRNGGNGWAGSEPVIGPK